MADEQRESVDLTTPADKQVVNPYYAYGILYLSPNFHEWEASKGPEYQRYRQAWVERPALHDAAEFPLNLNFEVTTRCNLACTFCTHSALPEDQQRDMPWELYAQVIDEGGRFATPAANLNALGEPLLVRDLPKRLAYAKQRGFLDVMFHTNGTIMNEALARELIESGLDRIIFSVDSPDKETYESMRINGRWERMVANVRTFAKVRNDRACSVPLIRTTMVLTERTLHQVDDFVGLWRPMADQITLQDLTWRTKLIGNETWRNREQTAVPIDLDEVRDEAIRHRLSFVCAYLYQSSYVFWNGDVIPCSNPNTREHMVMGRLDRQNLHEVWNGRPYRELRKLHESGKWYEHPVCRDCEVALVELYQGLQQRGLVAPQPGSAGKDAAGLMVTPRTSTQLSMRRGKETAVDTVIGFSRKSHNETTN